MRARPPTPPTRLGPRPPAPLRGPRPWLCPAAEGPAVSGPASPPRRAPPAPPLSWGPPPAQAPPPLVPPKARPSVPRAWSSLSARRRGGERLGASRHKERRRDAGRSGAHARALGLSPRGRDPKRHRPGEPSAGGNRAPGGVQWRALGPRAGAPRLALPPGLGAPGSVRWELASLETLGRGGFGRARPSRGSRLGWRSGTLGQAAGGRSAGVPRRPGRSSRRRLASSYCSG